MDVLIEFLSENNTRVAAWAGDLMLACTDEGRPHAQYVVMNKHNVLTYTVNIETWSRIRNEMRASGATKPTPTGGADD